jgi:putative transcriptional regulator
VSINRPAEHGIPDTPTQEAFAARYQIPLGTLRDWEQARAEPDQPARAYLRTIAGDPEGVERALRSSAERSSA